MNHKFLFALIALVINLNSHAQIFDNYMSTKGVGIFFDKKTIIRKAPLQLVKRQEIHRDYSYADFYEDEYTHKLYVKTSYMLQAVEDIVPLPKEPEVREAEVSVVSAPMQYPSGFVKRNNSSPGFTLELPMHHLFPDNMQIINSGRPGMNEQRILQQLNDLGLQRSERVVTRNGGFNINYDRLFINDEDKNKFLVIWLNNDRLYANFVCNGV